MFTSTTVTNLTANPLTSTISGYIRNYNNDLLEGVVVSCQVVGGATTTYTTLADGYYTFNVTTDKNYKIWPTSTEMVFNPNSRNYSNPVVSLMDENYKAEQNAVTITGYVYRTGSSKGLKGVAINVTGTPATTTATDDNGKYSFTALVSQSYTVTGTKAGWNIPGSVLSNVVTVGKELDPLYASPNPLTISGIVYNVNGTTALENVLVSCAVTGGQPRSLTTLADGKYSFSVHPDSVYKITAVFSGYAFNPTERNYTNPVANYTGENFRAEQKTYTVTGYVLHNSAGLANVTIKVTGTPTTNTVTDDQGKYEFTAYVGNTYTISSIKTGLFYYKR